MEEALRIIGAHRDCSIIQYFLSNGTLPSYSNDTMDEDLVDLPPGLTNIGNTCYLNSLFQFLFSISALREVILSLKIPNDLDSLDAIFPLTPYEETLAPRALQFAKLFQELLLELVYTHEMVVTPKKELPNLLFDGSAFGQQQDLTEALDIIIDFMMIVFKVFGLNLKTRSPFFGIEVQSIRYADKNGDQKVLTNDIDFRNTIIDVSSNLIDSLDNYFDDQPIDFENSSAFRSVAISKFPTCFAFRINRLSFDRESNQAVKSNQFVKFPKTLRLERFRAGRESFRQERNKKLADLRHVLEMKKERLTLLTSKMVHFATLPD